MALEIIVERNPRGVLPLSPLIHAPLCQNGHPTALPWANLTLT
jgi:hypothetical protein